MPAGPQAPASAGFDLQPDERVLWSVTRSYTSDKVAFWILGVLFAVILIGIYFIYQAVTIEGKSPRALIITNRRFVILEGNGSVTSHWLAQFVDLSAKRAQAQSHGQGLLGLAVSAAINAGLNAMAARNEKADPKYWGRTVGIVLQAQDGSNVTVAVKPNEALQAGPLLARCILLKEGDQIGGAQGPGIAPMLAPPAPSSPGLGMQIGGWLMLVVSALLGFVAVRAIVGIFVGATHVPSIIMLVFALALLAGACALLFFGARSNWKAAEAANKKPSKIVPLVVPAAFIAIATLAIGSSAVNRYLFLRDLEERYSTRSRSTATSTSTATATSSPTSGSTLSTTGGALSPAVIDAKLKAQGYTFEAGKSVEKSDFGGAPTWNWFMNHPSSPMAYVTLYDLSTDLVRDRPVAFSVTPRFALAVEVDGKLSDYGAARVLASTIATKNLTSRALITAAISGAGWKLTEAIDKDDEYTFGHRTFLAFAKKGTLSATIKVVDYSKAASGKDENVIQVIDRRVLLVNASTAGNPAPSLALARKLSGR